jgi:hypothetical protein
MVLPSSPNAISLNEMHIEAGGSTGTECTINDTDIRGLISKSSGTEMSFSEWWGASAGGTVTVSGEVVTHLVGSSGTAIAGIRFNSDGTVDKRVGGTYTQIDSGTDWIIPNGDADSTYDVSYTGASGTWSVQASTEGTWTNLGADRLYYVTATGGTGIPKSITCTFNIRKDGGSVIDSASFTCTATSEP